MQSLPLRRSVLPCKLPSSSTAEVISFVLTTFRVVDRRRSGHINHSLFWKNLAPAADKKKGHGGVLKDCALKQAIVESFGSLDNLKKEFNAATAAIQGSGWGWLVRRSASASFLTHHLLPHSGCQSENQEA